jgi:uracil-DNA glycosylase
MDNHCSFWTTKLGCFSLEDHLQQVMWYNTKLTEIQIPEHWDSCFDDIDFLPLELKLQEYSKKRVIYPKPNHLYKALELTNPEDVKVVILGQDPYFSSNQATGLSFSVTKETPIPSSLQNIFKELKSDGFQVIKKCDDLLECWAAQGVLMLNSSLTVSEKEPGGHKTLWKDVIANILGRVNQNDHVVAILWGASAQAYKKYFSSKHTVIESPHPSGQSAHLGFFGSSPFKRANQALQKHGQEEIDWTV